MRANPAFLRDEIIGWDGIGYKVVAKALSDLVRAVQRNTVHTSIRLEIDF